MRSHGFRGHTRVTTWAWSLLAAQLLLAVRVVARLARTARGERIPAVADAPIDDRASVLVPVLDERQRLSPCLDGLVAQGPEVAEILVVDGGSRDSTQELVAAYGARDPRVRLVDATPVPAAWNGKSHNLQVGLDRSAPHSAWILTIDADVRPAPGLARSLLAFARQRGVPALSVATEQEVAGAALAALHPALLTTLVYRFGIPGHATTRVPAVQANGQCFLLRRDVLLAVGGFAPTRDSLCEDVTLARHLASLGHRVGFYESDGLVSVAMYEGWRDAWRNWTRSLPLRDRYASVAGWLGLAEVALVQALPLPLVLALARRRPSAPVAALARFNAGLLAVRLGVLAGTARAYRRPPWGYWLSPACDAPAALGVWLSAVRRRHEWRGRPIVRGGPR
jgi:dolichol-phosphate mannosyltransferase